MFDTLRVLDMTQALYKHSMALYGTYGMLLVVVLGRYAVVYSIILSLYKISFAHARGLL